MKNLYAKGNDCREFFKNAYDNRYTWDNDFKGYKGDCSFLSNGKEIEGSFVVSCDFKPSVNNIKDKDVSKNIASQLFEVVIHRVKRSFEDVHSENTFIYGDINISGIEVIVGGKGLGDKYCINNGIITMVYRHIHGSLIQIYTTKTINTKNGYLSKEYTSQYLDPVSKSPITPIKYYSDTFSPFFNGKFWILTKRVIIQDQDNGSDNLINTFNFYNIDKS